MTQVALITGAAKRIGAAIATTLHDAGFHVMIHAHHSIKEAEALCDALNQRRSQSAAVTFADLSHANSPNALIAATLAWGGQLDCLIHNASLFISDQHLTPEAWQTLFKVNVDAPFYLSEAAAPYLTQQQGSILYLTDIHAHKPLKGYSVYCQTKAALTMQMLSFANTLAPFIRVNAVAPGAISWPEGNNALSGSVQEKIIAATLLQKHGQPKNIAQAVLCLIQNDYITGQILKVDGGRSLNQEVVG